VGPFWEGFRKNLHFSRVFGAEKKKKKEKKSLAWELQ